MRKFFIAALGVLGVMATAGLAMAAEAADTAASAATLDASGLGTVALAMCIGMGIAAAGCGIGQGLGLKGACEGVARNPEASNKLTNTLMLGLAFIESLAIYTFVICLILIFMRPFG